MEWITLIISSRDNALMGNIGHSCGCHPDMYHPPKHCCRPSTSPHGNGTLTAMASCIRTMPPTTLQKHLRNGLRNRTNSSRCQSGPQIPQISIWSSIHGTCWIENDSVWLPYSLASYRQVCSKSKMKNHKGWKCPSVGPHWNYNMHRHSWSAGN